MSERAPAWGLAPEWAKVSERVTAPGWVKVSERVPGLAMAWEWEQALAVEQARDAGSRSADGYSPPRHSH